MKNIFAISTNTRSTNSQSTNTKETNSNTSVNAGQGGQVTGSIVDVPKISNPFKATTVPGLVSRAITIMFALIVIAAVVVIIIAGFRMIVGGGNPDALKKSKTAIIWAIVGLLAAFMSYAIVSIIQKLL